jgi:hypothetical protein
MKNSRLGLDGKILLMVGLLMLAVMLWHLIGRGFHRHPGPPQVEVGG